MPRFRIPRFRSWTARTAAVVAAASLAALAFVQTTRSAGVAELASVSTLPVARIAEATDPRTWLARYGSPVAPATDAKGTLEVRVDDLIDFFASTGARSVDREVLALLVQSVLPGRDVESAKLGDVLRRYPRVRVVLEGHKVELGRLKIRALARRAAGPTARPIEDMTLVELLDAAPALRLGRDGTPSLDERAAGTAQSVLGKVRKVDASRDARFAERVELQAKYRTVLDIVQQLRLEGRIRGGSDPYDEAYQRLVDAGHEDAVSLLDGALKLQTELGGIDRSSLSRAERITRRWEARRVAFGPDVAALLFGRQEALERYEIDAMRITSNESLGPRAQARRLARLRTQLKVELAAQGSYVGFVDEARVGGGR